MLKTTVVQVGPAFNGYAVLPRLRGWEEFRRSLSRAPLDAEPDLSGVFSTPLGARYARSLARTAFRPTSLSAALALEHGLPARLRMDLRFLDAHGAAWDDRWELEVDVHGVVTEMAAESRIGDWAFSALDFSRFLEEIFAGL